MWLINNLFASNLDTSYLQLHLDLVHACDRNRGSWLKESQQTKDRSKTVHRHISAVSLNCSGPLRHAFVKQSGINMWCNLRNIILVMIGDTNSFSTRIWIKTLYLFPQEQERYRKSLGSVEQAISTKQRNTCTPSTRLQCHLLQFECQYNFWTHNICPID